MKRLFLALLIVCFATPHVAAQCDDDDDSGCVGLYVHGEFEITQDQVFSGLEDGVRAWGPDANLLISGGEIRGGGATGEPLQGGDGVDINTGAQVTVNGGQITGTDDGIKIKANSLVTINGGTIHGDDDGISAVDDSLVRIHGGDISGNVFGLLTIDHARTQMTGGTITGNISLRDDSSMSIQGGNVGSMRTSDWSTLKIFGGDFTGLIEADNNSRISVFLDPDTGRLLDGSAFDQLINRPRDANSVVLFLNTLTEDTVWDVGLHPSSLGVVDGPDGPTTVDFNTATGKVDVLYLAENSTANIAGGDVYSVTVDDTSLLNLSGGTVRVSYGDEAIFGKGEGTINMTGGHVTAYSDGIRLRGSSDATISGGVIDSFGLDGLDVSTFATATIDGGDIFAGDDGIRVKDQAVVTIRDGAIRGQDDGLSVAGSGTVAISGGSISGQTLGMRLTDSASVQLSGGEILGNVAVKGDSALHIAGGTIDSDVIVSDRTTITLSGGDISDDLRAVDSVVIMMSGGTIQGDLEARDHTIAEITGGTVGNRIQAQEAASVRVFGENMRMQDGRLTGTLLDGTPINTDVLALDEAHITAYDTFTSRQKVAEALRENIAVRGDGPTVHVDFLTGSSIPGELLVADDGRANIFGGSIAGPVATLRDGVLAVYGNDLQFITETDSTFRIRGTLADGTLADFHGKYDQRNPSDIRLYEVIRSDTTIPGTYAALALLDGPGGGPVVEINPENEFDFVTSVIDVRETGTLNFRQGWASSADLAAWDSGRINVIGGLLNGFREAIFARDTSTVAISGGVISGRRDGIRIWDSSSLTMTDGSLTGADDAIDVKDLGTVEIYGGEIFGGDEAIKAKGNSNVRVLGGTLTGNENGVSLEDDSRLTINGETTSVSGMQYGVLAIDDSFAEIRGGSISGPEGALYAADSSVIDIFGGQFDGDFFAAGGTINIYGTDLDLDGFNLTGFLQDGSEINLRAFVSDGGRFVLSSDLDRPCDFDANGICDLTDIDDLLYNGLGSGDAEYDLDGSGVVDLGDRDEWLRQAPADQGDFNFDGEVDATDLNILGTNWGATNLSSYAQGDSNGDGQANAADLNYLGSNWNAGRNAAQAVPEPGSFGIIVWSVLALSLARRPGF